MAKKTLPLAGEIVKKSNAVARAIWAINSIYEPRLVALVASKVRKDDDDFRGYEISVQELLGDRPDGRSYEIIKTVVENLVGRVIKLPKPNGFAACTIFSYCEYNSKTGIISCQFHPAMKPHYLKLSEKFTQYNLTEFLTLPSIYSQRLYEILKSWEDKADVEIVMSDLHIMLDVPESLKNDFTNFRRRVLEKAHADIHKHTSLKYEWEPIKKGRAVIAVKFTFAQKRAEKITREKELEDRRQKQKNNNKWGVAAVRCHEKQGGICSKQNPETKNVCKVCKLLFPK